jgi:hypothetical protein
MEAKWILGGNKFCYKQDIFLLLWYIMKAKTEERSE